MNPLTRFLVPGTVLNIYGDLSMGLFETFLQVARDQGWSIESGGYSPTLPPSPALPSEGNGRKVIVVLLGEDREFGDGWSILLPEVAKVVRSRPDLLLVGVSKELTPSIWKFVTDARLSSNETGVFHVRKHRGSASLQGFTFALDEHGEWVNASK